MLTLIADSGSTKTDWALCREGHPFATLRTAGLNPFQLTTDEIERALNSELIDRLRALTPTASVSRLRFYGAGCRDEGSRRMKAALSRVFTAADIAVASDMLCAARALLGHEAGIACIMGTGSNSCLYDGRAIVASVPPLGYVLGDEGSGAVLGRRLLADMHKGLLPPALRAAFREAYPADAEVSQVIERVYRSPRPNRYLASFVPFLKRHEAHPAVRSLVTDEFCRFFCRNVRAYAHPELSVNFVGSIAHHFTAALHEAAAACGYVVGEVLQSPFERVERL